jgi:hypothetical protein
MDPKDLLDIAASLITVGGFVFAIYIRLAARVERQYGSKRSSSSYSYGGTTDTPSYQEHDKPSVPAKKTSRAAIGWGVGVGLAVAALFALLVPSQSSPASNSEQITNAALALLPPLLVAFVTVLRTHDLSTGIGAGWVVGITLAGIGWMVAVVAGNAGAPSPFVYDQLGNILTLLLFLVLGLVESVFIVLFFSLPFLLLAVIGGLIGRAVT